MARKPRTASEDAIDTGDDVPVIDRNPDNGLGAVEAIDPNDFRDGNPSGDNQPGEAPKKRRGRRTKAELEAAGEENSGGGRKSSKARDLYITEKMLTVTLMTVNNTLAAKLNTPAFFLEQKEAEILAPAVLGVLDHYGWAKIRAKYGVWANLFIALGMVYAPKAQRAFGLDRAAAAYMSARNWAPGPAATDGAKLMGAFG